MTFPKAIFLTGITGTVGSWLAAEALRQGVRVIALVRDQTVPRAQDRVGSALRTAGADAAGVEIVSGDVCRPGLGLEDARRALAGVSAIWHCAAFTGFDRGSRQINYDTNVRGTSGVLELAEGLRLPVMYVSTAYIAGMRKGVVREDELDLGQSFHNPYEWSKCQAENLVRQWAGRTGLPAIILRPGIILGDWDTGRTIHFNTVYNLMRFFDSAVAAQGDQIRVLGRPPATKNLIPVDYFAKAAWHIISRGEPGAYHLTNPSPMSLEDLCRTFCQLFGTEGIRLVEQEDFDRRKPTRSERLLMTVSRPYAPYMQDEARFDRLHVEQALAGSAIDLPPLDLPYFRRLLAYARQADWGVRPAGDPKRDESRLGAPVTAPEQSPPACFERYFSTFLAGKMNRRLLENLKSLTATLRIIPAETPNQHWSLDIREGVLMSISRNGQAPQCSFLVGGPVFTEIVAGRLPPQQAFFRRQVEIGGDIETGLKVSAMLASFFRQFPFEAGGG